MDKDEILSSIATTCCRLKPSKIHGIGVHAILDIKKGHSLFPECACNLKEIVSINKSEVNNLNKNIIKMMSDFFIESDTHYFTFKSLNRIDISYFLNHSDHPNCKWLEEDDSYRTLRNIKEGEELTLNYDQYLESDITIIKNW